MMKTVIYEGEKVMGELEVELKSNSYEIMELLKKGLSILELSKEGERCHPISVLHTILSTIGVCFKLIEYKSPLYFQHEISPLFALHSNCIRHNKTIVVSFGDEEIHLVAMRSKADNKTACFWGFRVASGLYKACLGMLNLRCLSIVFDLDETLVVANTLRSFEDRIDALLRKASVETDSQKIAGMMAEVKRYQDDRAMLKQYAETDQVVDNGKVHKIQGEVVPALSDNHQTIVRPIIRLQDKSIVLTRINPQIRDTSVLVRLRPAWEDLRNYLTAKGRKRFEVFVCTMAERDYALEMWRLLDPDSNLINTAHVLDRVVCVKSGSKKSLINVFNGGICDPKMALVIDDRLKVWEDKDQPRVHVVPAFAPYYAPQAEANNAIPVLCVARNVACNVRGGFFKYFDDVILKQVHEISFEDDLKVVPSPSDVSNYLVVSEDNVSGSNGNKEPVCFDGIADAEVERRLKESAPASTVAPSLPSVPSLASVDADPRMTIPQLAAAISVAPIRANLLSQVSPQGSLNSSAQEGGPPESALDADTRRRLLILQHGHDSRDSSHIEPSFPIRLPPQANFAGPIPGLLPVVGPPVPGLGPGSVPRMHSRGAWFPVEDHMSLGPLGRPLHKEYHIGPNSLHIEKQHPPFPFQHRAEGFVRPDQAFRENKRPLGEDLLRNDRLRSNHFLPGHPTFQGGSVKKLKFDASLMEFAPDTFTSVVDAEVQRQIFMSSGRFSNNPAFLGHQQYNYRP